MAGKAELSATGQGNAFDLAGDVPFKKTGTGHGHGFAVHGGGGYHGAFYLSDLFPALDRAQGDNGLEQSRGRIAFNGAVTDAQQFFQLGGILLPVGRQEVDLPALAQGVLQCVLELGERPGFVDADPGAAAFQRRLRTHPNDVIDVEIVAEDRLPVLIDVDERGQAWKAQAEKV